MVELKTRETDQPAEAILQADINPELLAEMIFKALHRFE